jgi:hypothetical protein
MNCSPITFWLTRNPTPYKRRKTRGNNESSEKNANAAARLGHPWRKNDVMASLRKRTTCIRSASK